MTLKYHSIQWAHLVCNLKSIKERLTERNYLLALSHLMVIDQAPKKSMDLSFHGDLMALVVPQGWHTLHQFIPLLFAVAQISRGFLTAPQLFVS